MVSAGKTPLRREYCCPQEDQPVSSEEIVRGYEVGEGSFVTVTDEELSALAPEKSRDIDLRRFVPKAEVSPMLFGEAYFLAPAADSNKAYRLLAETLERNQRVGVATFVMRGKAYLVAILSEAGLLRAQTLRFFDELRSPAEVGLPEVTAPHPERLHEVQRLVKALKRQHIDTSELQDSTLRRTHELIERKLAENRDIVPAPETPEASGADVIDLMEALKRSLAPKPNGRKRSKTHKATVRLKEQTKEQLYERAQALGIQGRSSMRKPDLVKAVRRADASFGDTSSD